MGKFILISKDAMSTDYLPIYGNHYWKTPNIDALASKGTVFTNYHAAAPSTVMAFYSMATGKFAHETNYEMYDKSHDVYIGETFFSKLKKQGIETHIIWSPQWMPLLEYHDYFRGDVEFHILNNVAQRVGAHLLHDGFLKPNDKLAEQCLQESIKVVKSVLAQEKDMFVWLHLPHVLNGRVSYGGDIDVFDRYIGEIRKLIPDDCIAITADHGNMNGHKGKVCYAYDVYEAEARIPLITPRIDGLTECKTLLSAVDLYSILVEKKINARDYIYCDTAYRAQKHRKLAIMHEKYKYIYNKENGTEELYDLEFDPQENFSIMTDYVYDRDRKINAPSRELYFYPEWDKLEAIRKKLRKEKERIWKNGSVKVIIKSNLKDVLRPFYVKVKRRVRKK